MKNQTIADLITNSTAVVEPTIGIRVSRNLDIMVRNPQKWSHYAQNIIKSGKFWNHYDRLAIRIEVLEEEQSFSGLPPELTTELLDLVELRDYFRNHVTAK